MSDSSTARRALFAVAGSALVLGATAQAASADAFDVRHMSVNQGASCALHDLDETGQNVVNTGSLPKVFDHVDPGSDRTDGIKELCHAVKAAPPPANGGAAYGAAGLLGGLPVGR